MNPTNLVLPLSTRMLLMVCEDSDRRGYNRLLDTDSLRENLAPGGIHMMIVSLPHHTHVAGKEQPEDNWQHRCLVMVLLTENADDPSPTSIGYLDVNVALWEELMSYVTVVAQIGFDSLRLKTDVAV